mmetsp:Transcript_2793/g.5135  ORF Transcript_2793/g.5135 Transcript_2793/m.5135 type:complete len:156 (-) Transcript_2793:1073-1540(-)
MSQSTTLAVGTTEGGTTRNGRPFLPKALWTCKAALPFQMSDATEVDNAPTDADAWFVLICACAADRNAATSGAVVATPATGAVQRPRARAGIRSSTPIVVQIATGGRAHQLLPQRLLCSCVGHCTNSAAPSWPAAAVSSAAPVAASSRSSRCLPR